MQRIEAGRISELLGGPYQAVLSVGREHKGPVAVPMSYHYSGGKFFMATSPDSLHGRLMQQRGRATVTVQYADCDGHTVEQWYIMAEGPIHFSTEDPMRHIMEILVKDRGHERVAEWRAASPTPEIQLAVLEPERIAGYESIERLYP